MSGAPAGMVMQAERLFPCDLFIGFISNVMVSASERAKLEAARPLKVLLKCPAMSTTFYQSEQVTYLPRFKRWAKDSTSEWEELWRILIYHIF